MQGMRNGYDFGMETRIQVSRWGVASVQREDDLHRRQRAGSDAHPFGAGTGFLPARNHPPGWEDASPQGERVKFQLYKGEDGAWWRRFVLGNGREIFRSSEGYQDRADAVVAITIGRNSTTAERIELKEDGKWYHFHV